MANLRNHALIPSFQRPASRVMIRRAASYEQELGTLIYESLADFELPVKDKVVLLKPNLVGLDPLGIMNTHPAVIAATRESFLRLGASQVLIGDGPAMDRDTEAIIESVRLREFVGPLARTFVDLNIDDVERVSLANAGFAIEGAVFSEDRAGGGFFCFHAQAEDPPLGGRDAVAEESVRGGARELLWMAEERAALGGNR